MTSAKNQQVRQTILSLTIGVTLCLILVGTTATASEQIDQSNLPEWGGGWTHVNPTGEDQAVMWQTFVPSCPNLTAVEIDILTNNPGQGDDVLTVEIAKDGDVLASAKCSIADGFDGLLRFEFPEAVPLVPDQIYELKVRDTGKTRFGWKYGPNTYERGSRYVFTEERPGTDWLFQTYSDVEPAQAKYGGGTGEPDDPYQIATAGDLMLLGESPEDYDKHFILTADIDLDPNLPGRKAFDKAVIAPDTDPNDTYSQFQGTPFSGVFNGNSHKISHLTITGGGYLGLFGLLGHGAKIANLGMEAVDINGMDYYVAGLVGHNRGSIITNYSTGIVNGNENVGGLVGWNEGSITTSHSTSIVSGVDYTGGLVGTNVSSITSSCSTGTVAGHDYVGGLVGFNAGGDWGNGIITSSYSSAAISGTSAVGGLVGTNNWSSIVASYSTGMVSGNGDVGGLVGYNNWGIITMSFWDMETSGSLRSAAGTGLTSDEMKDIKIYLNAGWDFVDEILNGTCDYWQISPGDYPRLHHCFGNGPAIPEGLGTAKEPYLIRDARDLGTVWFNPVAHYRLETSLDLSGTTWSMAVVPWFGGTFDGNGYAISNLNIQGDWYLGLFGALGFGAKIFNLGLEEVDINGRGRFVGGLVGLNGDWDSPGIITSCYSSGTIKGEEYVGGLVGRSWSGSISTSYSTSMVSGSQYVGGIVGENGYVSDIATSYSTGTVNGNSPVGGLVGGNRGNDANITLSFWDTETSGQATSAGGTGKSTAEMHTAGTFLNAGWDFVDETANGTEDIWWIDEGNDYPRLWWENHNN